MIGLYLSADLSRTPSTNFPPVPRSTAATTSDSLDPSQHQYLAIHARFSTRKMKSICATSSQTGPPVSAQFRDRPYAHPKGLYFCVLFGRGSTRCKIRGAALPNFRGSPIPSSALTDSPLLLHVNNISPASWELWSIIAQRTQKN